MKNLAPWGIVMEYFRGKRSIRALQTRKIMSVSHYKKSIQSKKGPTVQTLDKFLEYCERDWSDWAQSYQLVKEGKPLGATEGTAIELKQRRLPKKNPKLVANGHQP